MKKTCTGLLLYSLNFTIGCLGAAVATPTDQEPRFPTEERMMIEGSYITPTDQGPRFPLTDQSAESARLRQLAWLEVMRLRRSQLPPILGRVLVFDELPNDGKINW